MKITALVAAALFAGTIVQAQTTPATPAQPATDTTATTKVITDTASQPTVLTDTSVGKAYVSNPDKLKGLTSETITPAHVFPALGTFKASGDSKEDVTITLDESNKGIVWVDGLPQGKIKALLLKAPSTYKIPMQTSANGKAVSEGTLYVNPETNELTIVLGRPYSDANPSALTIEPKKKAEWHYTGVKTDATTAASPAPQQ